MRFLVTTKHLQPFRRCGITFGKLPTVVDTAGWPDDKRRALLETPILDCQEIAESAPPLDELMAEIADDDPGVADLEGSDDGGADEDDDGGDAEAGSAGEPAPGAPVPAATKPSKRASKRARRARKARG